MMARECWALLQKESREEVRPGFISRRVLLNAPIDCFLALEIPSKIPVLYLLIEPKEFPDGLPPLLQMDGMEMRYMTVPEVEPAKVSVQLLLRSEDKLEIFFQFIDDLLNRLSKSTEPGHALSLLVGRVRQWQQFMSGIPSSILSADAQKGLFGELWFIRWLLKNCANPGVILGWVGSSGAPQDFQFEKMSLECKSTSTYGASSVKISSERQLDYNMHERLFLFSLALEQQKARGERLNLIVAEIREMLGVDSVFCAEFEVRLEAAGIPMAVLQSYDEYGYLVHGQEFYEVRSGFPCIKESELPTGIRGVAYSIDLAACQEFIVDGSVVLGLLSEHG